jgi:outer membrane protein assembly factor BamB/tetratricopeptide (TPR) repeat protein
MRRFVAVVTVLGFLATLACLQTVAAQGRVALRKPIVVQPVPPPGVEPGKEAEGHDALILPTNSDAKRLFGLADDYIKEEAWGQAARVLQALLDNPEDTFLQVKRKGPDNKETTTWLSVRVEANRLLGTMGPQGLQFYELQHGGKAKSLLAEAKSKSDPQILADVALRYLHTEAGAEAINLLGTYCLDRGHFGKAALYFDQLLSREGDKAAPLTLFKACMAFRRAGEPAKAEKAWKRLEARAPDGLALDDERVPLDRLKGIVAKAPAPRGPSSVYDWPLFRGDNTHSAQGQGSTPFREPKWLMSLLPDTRDAKEGRPFVEKYLKSAVGPLESRQLPTIPGGFPIAAGGRIIYRSYEGIHAVDPKKNYDLEWYAPAMGSLGYVAKDPEMRMQLQQWCDQWYIQWGPQNLLFDNSTVGSLSSDNVRVYMVDDLALPPHPMFIQQMFGGGQPQFGKLQSLIEHSALQAIDLDSGKLLWERGARDNDDLKGTYFLGPPLPLGGKLYVLNEKAQELRLVCLDAARGDTNWAQTLATARDRLLQDIGRRVNAAHLAYADGILVCPTNAGAVLGVDLLSHSLIWAYPYREGSPVLDQQELIKQRVGPWGGMPYPARLGAETWKACAPIIQDGKVVLTAPDGGSIRCINLRDGVEVWRAGRDSDLYIGGVFTPKGGGKDSPLVFVVGKNSCRALSLATGQQKWKFETGLPSGLGVASGNKYYLPLRSAGQSKEPEICVIDLDRAMIEAHTKARTKDEVFGNLLFYDKDVISQTINHIAAYPQLNAKLDLITKSLAKDPKNPVGLIERGELRLDKGDLQGAVEDLRTAMANHPPAEMKPKARNKLYETFTQLFQQDFNANEKYLKEYEELCKVEVRPDALPEEQQRAKDEEQRRQSNFFCLLAKGREKQGKLVDAFQAYRDFSASAGNRELVSVIDEPSVKARPDVWAQGRIAAMIAKASGEQRKPLEAKIAEEWNAVRDANDTVKLRRFVDLFGSLFSVGREARLLLAERLMQEDVRDAFLEAELQLQQVRQQKEDPTMAARAVEALARLMIRKGLLEDAAYFYRELGRDYPKVVIRDGKTGADYFNELVTDKRFLPYIDGPRGAGKAGPYGADNKGNPIHTGGRIAVQPSFSFEPEGEPLPFFHRHRFVMEQNTFALKQMDRESDQEVWRSQQLGQPYFLFNGGYPNLRFNYHMRGHLMVLNLGTAVYAFDPVDHKKLWEKNLSGLEQHQLQMGGGLPPGSRIAQDRDGVLQIVYPNGDVQRLGQTGPIEPSYVCLQTREGLIAVDPVLGTTLWTKSDVSTRSQIFGDDQNIYVVDLDEGGNVVATRALRAHDGVSVSVPNFTEPFKHRQRILGRYILWSDTELLAGLVFHLHDLQTGKDVWRKSFPSSAKMVQADDSHLAGVVDLEGNVTVLDLYAQKEVLRAKVEADDAKKATDIHLLQDHDQFYVAFNEPIDRKLHPGQGPWPNVSHGMRSFVLNGTVYAFDRATGKLHWATAGPVENQMMVLEQFKELPVLLFTAQYTKMNNPAQPFNRYMMVEFIDKRTGKLILRKEMQNQNQQPFFALTTNVREGSIELINFEMKIRLSLAAGAELKKADKASRPTGAVRGSGTAPLGEETPW